ncbi:glycosyltransferase family 21 protein [Coniophora puteana RWD-64-598 SS2]|uniref:Ceramide glucosyltransferase n=1 Tax=Coniophora puteana (strain RWD-64-598) TaxID=741705 RepID=A0A5M3N6D5_CONPW|nr:glycosyltransferase family 21 protein [Coniophora puteana RWD-64-598 SS2]EIW86876.1 glycosyltransferase family 21 protein [Coniophora puteana RWD-64-598 SS2]
MSDATGALSSSFDRGTVLQVLAVVGVVWYFILWTLGLLGCYNARKRYRNPPRSSLTTSTTAPGVSILRPLKGLDPNLYENLESTFTQEYPNFEILLSVADEDDQALSVVRELISKYPQVNAKVIVGSENVGINPKVNNLVRSYREATNDILWVIDSNVSMSPGTLAHSVEVFDPPAEMSSTRRRIALVHHVPYVSVSEDSLAARVEAAFLNTNHAKMYIAINTVAIDSCVVGKSNLYRRSDVERVDGSLKRKHTGDEDGHVYGLPAFGRYLAEDNMIAGALWHELGLRHDLSCDVAQTAVGKMTFADYVGRRVRWIRVRKHMVLAATLVEPFTESFVAGLISSVSMHHLWDFRIWLCLLIHFVTWIYVDLDVQQSLAGRPLPPKDFPTFLAAWLIREILALPIWFYAVIGNQVSWRGRTYEVLRDGEVKRANSGSFVGAVANRLGQSGTQGYTPLATTNHD